MYRSLYSKTYDALRLWLKSKRDEKGLSIRALAEMLGRHHSIVGKIEQSRRKIDIVEFVEYCRILGVDPHDGLEIIILEMESVKATRDK
jgi:transcriptional regulator with XRE-family HTH domain